MKTFPSRTQTKLLATIEDLSLRTSQVSPYYDVRRGAIVQTTMILKCFILGYSASAGVNIKIETSDSSIDTTAIVPLTIGYSSTDASIKAAVESSISTYFTTVFSIQAPDVYVWDFVTPTDLTAAIAGVTSAPAVINGATHSIVTGTGATGFQISTTRNVFASYSVTVSTTATIGGSSSGTVVLEVASTNSATAGDWVEIARFTNGQSISLAVALQSVQTLAGQVNGMVPAGYYAKIRSINNSGTPTYTFNSGREILQ